MTCDPGGSFTTSCLGGEDHLSCHALGLALSFSTSLALGLFLSRAAVSLVYPVTHSFVRPFVPPLEYDQTADSLRSGDTLCVRMLSTHSVPTTVCHRSCSTTGTRGVRYRPCLDGASSLVALPPYQTIHLYIHRPAVPMLCTFSAVSCRLSSHVIFPRPNAHKYIPPLLS